MHNDDTDPQTTLNGLHILVIEDAWQIGEATKDFLRSLGAKVSGPLATKAEADRLLSEYVPHVALVDLLLRDGERADDLIEQLNDLGVRVLVVSGYQALGAPRDKIAGILNKPFTDDQLLAALQQLTRRAQESSVF